MKTSALKYSRSIQSEGRVEEQAFHDEPVNRKARPHAYSEQPAETSRRDDMRRAAISLAVKMISGTAADKVNRREASDENESL